MSNAILYQMKATDENHGKIFQGLKDDLEIDLNDYEKVAEIGLSEFKKVFKNDIDGMLESIFSYGNTNKGFRQKNPNARSISVSDIIEIDGKYYYCDIFGFKEVSDKVKVKQEEAVENYMDKLSVNYMSRIFNQMKQNGWDGKEETADKYFDDIMRKLDPDFEKNNLESQEQAQDDSEPLREEKEYIETHKDELEKQAESKKLQEEDDTENISINDLEDNVNDESDKTILDYLEARIGEEISVGELNTFLQSLFGKFETLFITADTIYNQDPEERQELVVWDDEDMYTITYEIEDQMEPTIEITDINVE